MNNVRHIGYFIIFFINYWRGEWLLVNEKVILMVDLDKNNKRLTISTFYKNVVK